MIWYPFEDLRKMHMRGDKLFNQLASIRRPLLISKGKEDLSVKGNRIPVGNIKETEKSVIANIELPGIPKENIELNVTEDSIEVFGKQKTDNEVKGKGTYNYQSSTFQFYRKIPLSMKVVPEKAVAVLKDGLLKVEVLKAEQIDHKGKRIDIK